LRRGRARRGCILSSNFAIRSQTKRKKQNHGQAKKRFHSRNPRTSNTSHKILVLMTPKSRKFATHSHSLGEPIVETRRICQTSRKSASHRTSAESFRVQGTGRRQTIDHRSTEAKSFYVPTRSQNCLNRGGGESWRPISGVIDGRGLPGTFPCLHITANTPCCLVD
jgi:hypothetical protein